MTAVGNILKSYLNPRRFVFWLLVLGAAGIPLCLAVMHEAAHVTGNMSFPARANYLFWPLFSFGFGISAVGWHLRQILLEGEDADMPPNYNKRQLAAAGIIVMAYLFVFTALTLFHGWQPLPALAGFLGVTAMTLWFGANFMFGIMVLVYFPLGIAARFFPDNSVSRMSVKTCQAVWTIFSAHGNAWSGLLIVLSLGGVILFCFRYLNINCASAVNHRFFFTGFGHMQFLQLTQGVQPAKKSAKENKNSLADRLVENAVFQMTDARRRGQRFSFFQLARLISFAMFQLPPRGGYNRAPIRLLSACYGLLVIILAFSRSIAEPVTVIACALPLMYSAIVSTLGFIFQSNKNQLPMLYLQTDLPSKSAFMKAAAAGYLLLIAEAVLILTGAALITHVFFPCVAWPRMFQVVFITAAMVLVQISIPFFTGNRRKTPPGPGRTIGILMVLYPALIISLGTSSWTAAGICLITGALIFYAALRRWMKSEMDCT